MPVSRYHRIESSLRAFVEAVETVGGVRYVDSEEHVEEVVPAFAQNWPDLGLAYLDACEALSKTPKFDADGRIEQIARILTDTPLGGSICEVHKNGTDQGFVALMIRECDLEEIKQFFTNHKDTTHGTD